MCGSRVGLGGWAFEVRAARRTRCGHSARLGKRVNTVIAPFPSRVRQSGSLPAPAFRYTERFYINDSICIDSIRRSTRQNAIYRIIRRPGPAAPSQSVSFVDEPTADRTDRAPRLRAGAKRGLGRGAARDPDTRQ